jgi:hypothetical protein
MFGHLHNCHGYQLLKCVDTDPNHDHEHDDDTLTLDSGSDIFYEEDIKCIHQHLGHSEFGKVCLSEACRRKGPRMADLAKIDRDMEKALEKIND